MQIDITIHDIINEPDGITIIEPNGGTVRIPLTDWERELLRERLEEKV